MQRLIDGRLSVSCTDSPEDIATFFAELRRHRRGAAAQEPTATGASAGHPNDGDQGSGSTPPPVSGGKQ
ncbi:protein of unknown function [Hyphomicrobium sp. 1Nfss2.1]|uniref:hypothetical protein n=1 Tax=Hyphomicrobium sp. 1Nfss2.1 TaxID=3413936 RepID=UPI003C7CB98C